MNPVGEMRKKNEELNLELKVYRTMLAASLFMWGLLIFLSILDGEASVMCMATMRRRVDHMVDSVVKDNLCTHFDPDNPICETFYWSF